jgi:hypothetical protein
VPVVGPESFVAFFDPPEAGLEFGLIHERNLLRREEDNSKCPFGGSRRVFLQGVGNLPAINVFHHVPEQVDAERTGLYAVGWSTGWTMAGMVSLTVAADIAVEWNATIATGATVTLVRAGTLPQLPFGRLRTRHNRYTNLPLQGSKFCQIADNPVPSGLRTRSGQGRATVATLSNTLNSFSRDRKRATFPLVDGTTFWVRASGRRGFSPGTRN